jgi:SAM-dependent methyltransferase
VIASLFRLPFEHGTFDHVHSQGVLHHTYSTEAAFRSIAAFSRPGGSLFIWVYGQEDSLVVPGMRGALVRAYWLVSHHVGRPILSRLPAPVRNVAMIGLTAAAHPIVKMRSRRGQPWAFRNTLHGLRDAFTPRYAHQHGFNEVLTWFEDAGFEPRLQSPSRYRDLIGRRLVGVGVVGRRTSTGNAV